MKKALLTFFAFLFVLTVSSAANPLTKIANNGISIDGDMSDWDELPLSVRVIGYKKNSGVDFSSMKVAFDDNYFYFLLNTTTNLNAYASKLKKESEILQVFIDKDRSKKTGSIDIESFNEVSIPNDVNGFDYKLSVRLKPNGVVKVTLADGKTTFKKLVYGGIALSSKAEDDTVRRSVASGDKFIELKISRKKVLTGASSHFLIVESFKQLGSKTLARYNADVDSALVQGVNFLSGGLLGTLVVFLVIYLIFCIMIFKKAKIGAGSALMMLTPIGFFQLLYARSPLHTQVDELSMVEEEFEE